MSTEYSTKEIVLSEKMIVRNGIIFEKVSTQENREGIGNRGLSLDDNSTNFQQSEPAMEMIYWGVDNQLPQDIIKTVVDNTITPGLLSYKALVTVSLGLRTFEKKQVGKAIVHEEILDTELEEWLEDIEITDYLRAASTDANYLYNVFAEVILNKDKNRVNQLNRLDASFCRLELDKKFVRFYKSWNDVGSGNNYERIPAHQKNTAQHKFVVHSRNYFTGFPHYGYPHFWGAKNWLKFANKIPSWKLAAIQNGMSIKYHVKIPANYFQEVYPDSRINPDTKKAYTDIDRYQKEVELRGQMEAWLTGSDNAHKTFISKFGIGIDGKALPGWEIIVLDDKTKYEAYIEDYNTSNQAITSAHNVDPSLASINTQGQLSSGSDKKHAYNILTNIVVNELRDIILKPVMIAKNITFPNKRNIKLDFRNVMLVDASVQKSSIKTENIESQNNEGQENAS